MADRDDTSRREAMEREEEAGNRGREGFGDDAGTRVGSPTPATDPEYSRGPSTQPVSEGLEGAVLEDDAKGGKTGMGAEGAEGIHDAKGSRSASDRSGIDSSADQIGSRGGVDRRGSEPMPDRKTTHEENYGGKMGEPRE